jgi:hypothetical protein
MPRLSQGDMHVNRPLGDLTFAAFSKIENNIAKELPLVRSLTKSNQYHEYNIGDLHRVEVAARAPSTRAKRIGLSLVQRTFTTVRYSLAYDVSDEQENNYDTPLDPEGDGARLLATNMALFHEDDMNTVLFATGGVWLATLTGVSGVPAGGQFKQWNDAASTPLADIRGQKEAIRTATGYEPNEVWTSSKVWSILVDNASIIDRYKANGGGTGARSVVTKQALAELLEVDVIRVSKAIKNTAGEGLTDSFADVVGKKLLLVYMNRAPRPQIREPSAVYKFAWTGFYGAEETGMRTKRYRQEDVGSTTIEVDSAFITRITGINFGVLFNTAIA